jgi:alpha,alpha-trehalase
MHRPTNLLRVAFSLLLQGLLIMSYFPKSSAGKKTFRKQPYAQTPPAADGSQPLVDILRYISTGWDDLTRTMTRCESLTDIKTDQEPVLFLPADFPSPPALSELQKHCAVRVEYLPNRIAGLGELGKIRTNGLLYLENPYVVPGGQFNEMYGWDSYFIIRGLLRDHRPDLAKGVVENFFFEIEHYGGVLNANRTYYLTRSQPPFLSSMILAVYDAEKAAGKPDLQWLEKAYGFAVRDYQQWTRQPHLAGATGLARYFDHGDGPVPEIMGDPSHYYRGVAHYFLIHGGANDSHLVHVDSEHLADSLMGPLFPVTICDPSLSQTKQTDCANSDQVALTADFYKGDRSMRESGFDVTFRFGLFGADTHHYAPVCLNSLLYKTEQDLREMSILLGRKEEAQVWRRKALGRRTQIVKYLWDEHRGLFFDYDFVAGARSSYEYATTFYPLWAGVASKEQARAVVRNLAMFEQPGGLAMSRRETQAQWDYPYGWAPIHLLAVEGLRRYGYDLEANRISSKFLATVIQNFLLDHTIREKYDVVTGSDITHIEAGYKQNVTGFGWTNGVFLELLHQLPPGLANQLAAQAYKDGSRLKISPQTPEP